MEFTLLRIIMLFILLLTGAAYAAPSYAASSENKIGAAILDPTTLNIREAQKLCREETALLKCDIVRERFYQAVQRTQQFGTQMASFKNATDDYYNVLNANFE